VGPGGRRGVLLYSGEGQGAGEAVRARRVGGQCYCGDDTCPRGQQGQRRPEVRRPRRGSPLGGAASAYTLLRWRQKMGQKAGLVRSLGIFHYNNATVCMGIL
jgi:hypothetical protein